VRGESDLKITEEVIPHIEKAMGLKLYENQVNHLLGKSWSATGRRNGKTLSHCIKLALSEGEPLNMKKPYEFSDYGDGSRRYAYYFYKNEFMRIRDKLKYYGFAVRNIRF